MFEVCCPFDEFEYATPRVSSSWNATAILKLQWSALDAPPPFKGSPPPTKAGDEYDRFLTFNATEVTKTLKSDHLWIAVRSQSVNILISQGHFFCNLVSKETLKPKSALVRVEIIQAEINTNPQIKPHVFYPGVRCSAQVWKHMETKHSTHEKYSSILTGWEQFSSPVQSLDW